MVRFNIPIYITIERIKMIFYQNDWNILSLNQICFTLNAFELVIISSSNSKTK